MDLTVSLKEAYWQMIQKYNNQTATGQFYWTHQITAEIDEHQWSCHFVALGKIMKSTKLRYFQYRLTNRKLV